MTKSKFSKSIIQRIETENIKPQSKWYFRAKNWSFWSFFFIALLIGSLSFALIVFALKNTDFQLLEYLDKNESFVGILALFPLLWVFAIGVAVGFGIWGLKSTKRGYRIALATLVGGNILGSMFFGTLVYGAGGGEYIEDILEENIKTYKGVRAKHQKFWGNPEKTGRLAGLIDSIDRENKTITLSDPNGKTWTVDVKDKNKNLQVGLPVKMRGKVLTDGNFLPQNIRPALKQYRTQRKIQQYFHKNPELRKKIIKKLAPQLREKIKEARKEGRKPSQKLKREVIKNIKKSATPVQKERVKKVIKNSIKDNVRISTERKKRFEQNLEPRKQKIIQEKIKEVRHEKRKISERKAQIKRKIQNNKKNFRPKNARIQPTKEKVLDRTNR